MSGRGKGGKSHAFPGDFIALGSKSGSSKVTSSGSGSGHAHAQNISGRVCRFRFEIESKRHLTVQVLLSIVKQHYLDMAPLFTGPNEATDYWVGFLILCN